MLAAVEFKEYYFANGLFCDLIYQYLTCKTGHSNSKNVSIARPSPLMADFFFFLSSNLILVFFSHDAASLFKVAFRATNLTLILSSLLLLLQNSLTYACTFYTYFRMSILICLIASFPPKGWNISAQGYGCPQPYQHIQKDFVDYLKIREKKKPSNWTKIISNWNHYKQQLSDAIQSPNRQQTNDWIDKMLTFFCSLQEMQCENVSTHFYCLHFHGRLICLSKLLGGAMRGLMWGMKWYFWGKADPFWPRRLIWSCGWDGGCCCWSMCSWRWWGRWGWRLTSPVLWLPPPNNFWNYSI